ncbi:MAG: type II/IV secretion system protein, partial [Gammaproteobacteria bacterium]|nr:type II/IV secretion system protein [Gammaproteobacteria bacterium]
MSAVFDNNIKHNQRLEVHDILKWLEEDAMVDVDNAQMLRTLAVGAEYKKKNPLEVIAERNWVNPETKQQLTLDALTKWFADRVDMPFVRIDPLKVEVADVTEVMSYAYAARYNVLPIQVDDKTITIATAQPFERDWEPELSQIHNKAFKLVIANPDDIRRLLVEFYSISKSIH